MLKRISSSDLRVGMFIEEFCGSWMDHPFWRPRFLVRDAAELERICESGVSELWIDSSKGIDIGVPDPHSADRNDADSSVERHLNGLAAEAANVAPAVGDLRAELDRASKIFRESRKVVADMFGEARLGKVRNTDAARVVVDNVAESVSRHPTAMIGLARLKSADDYTFMHSIAVCALMVSLARTLGFDEQKIRTAGMSGLLHDVGKAQIPLSILNKAGTLDEEEWKTMRSHPERGHAMLQGTSGVTPEVLDAVLHHHEKIDGSGYPHRLSLGAISELAKMAAACDVYDAVTSNRPYRPGWQPTIAVRKMTEWTGHFENGIFKAFVRTVGIYPIGSLVRLKSQRLAVVVDHDPAHLLQPTVKVFFSLRSKMHVAPTIVKLSQRLGADRIVGFEDPAAHGFTRLEELWVPPTAVLTA